MLVRASLGLEGGVIVISVEPEPVSPRIVELERQLHRGDPAILAAFWERLKAEGAPIIEPIPGDDHGSLVTFVWQQSAGVREVAVYGPGLPPTMLRQLGDTDLFYCTYRRRNDFRSSYRLALDPPVSLPIDTEEKASQFGTYVSNVSNVELHIQDPLNPKGMRRATLRDPARPEDPSRDILNSIVELAQAPSQPYLARRADIPHGWVHTHVLRSAVLGNERNVAVYTPPGYSESSTGYGLLITFDGGSYLRLVPTTTSSTTCWQRGSFRP